MVNAVLRRIQREGELLPEGESLEALSARWSMPLWILERWQEEDSESLPQRLEAYSRPAPLSLRPDGEAPEREALAERLRAEGGEISLGSCAPDALKLRGHPSPFKGESFRDGWWRAQDEGSQLVVQLLAPKPGESIWDTCAAPGGKSRYIARLIGGEGRILASDLKSSRVRSLKAGLSGSGVEVRRHDASKPQEERFDAVLIDAPCSGLGTLRRHPEIKWRRRPHEIQDAALRQRQILEASCVSVKPGGRLIYSVCTETPEEGSGLIKGFLERHPEFGLEAPEPREGIDWSTLLEGGCLRTRPERHDADGFFAARLRRSL